MAPSVRDLVIIGSGPAGYTAAIYGARAALKPLLVAGWTPGGALMNTTVVENFPGFVGGVEGPALMEAMATQAQEAGAELLEEEVETLVRQDDGTFLLGLTDESQVVAKAVILAMGAEHRHLGVPGEESLGARGVSYCATCDANLFTGLPCAVVGGGDSAVEEATFLAKFASSVTLIHRRGKLRASQAMQARIAGVENLTVRYHTEVLEAQGTDSLRGLRLRDTRTGEESHLAVEGLFIAIGHDPRSSLVSSLVSLKEGGYVKTFDGTAETSLPGLFACGDLVDSRYRQAITAAGSGAGAALDAASWLAEEAVKGSSEGRETPEDAQQPLIPWENLPTKVREALSLRPRRTEVGEVRS